MTAADGVELALLVVADAVLTVLCCAFLMISLGAVPFPITALIAGAANLGFLWLAAQYTSSPWRFAPLAASALVIVIAMVPGLGGSSAWITGLPLILILLFGLGVPASVAARPR
ncbi:hypothetical protein [Gordonia caeni]|uniref:Integral membrane protein n=1 Tax=Gordonia caeni TaxID=1007097 RepID=A0ABP7P0M4_9ACTN